jgi:hypothetical protein
MNSVYFENEAGGRSGRDGREEKNNNKKKK